MSRPDRRILLAIGVLALSLVIGSIYRAGYLPGFRGEKGAGESGRSDREGGEGESGGRGAPVSVTTAPARVADVPVTIDAVGTVQALNTVTVRTQVDGRLLRLAFTEGQDVHKDDIIAEIDPALYRAQYEQVLAKKAQDEANLANARLDRERYQRLVEGKFLSQQQYATQKALVQQLEAQVRADQAAIDSAKTTLDYATIRAPIDGRAGIRLVDVGNLLRATDQNGIVVITQIKPIYVMFTLPQQSLAAVQKAKSDGEAQVLALGQDNATQLAKGELAVVDNQIDQLTGTVRLKAVFQNEDLSLWPGQFVNVRLMLETIKQATVTPSPAVQRGPSGAFVYVRGEDGLAHMRSVTTGRQDEASVVILSGLKPGETVIVSGFSRLSDGAKVRVIDNGGSTAAGAGDSSAPGKGRPAGETRSDGAPR